MVAAATLGWVLNNKTSGLDERGGFMGVGGGPCLGTAGVGAKKFWVVPGGRVALEKSVVVTSVGLISSSSCCSYFVLVVSI